MRHIQGEPRQQRPLFPDSFDEYLSADHTVRVIDALLDSLEMAPLGFTPSTTQETGRQP